MAAEPRRHLLEIVPAKPEDLDAIMEIERLSFKSPWTRQMFVEELRRDFARLDVLRDAEGRILGFVNHWLVYDEVHVLNIAVHPEFRRRGYGERLMRHVLKFAGASGCRLVTLEVRRSNEAAKRLYGSLGFRPIGVRPNYYAEDGEDAIVMVLLLP